MILKTEILYDPNEEDDNDLGLPDKEDIWVPAEIDLSKVIHIAAVVRDFELSEKTSSIYTKGGFAFTINVEYLHLSALMEEVRNKQFKREYKDRFPSQISPNPF